MLLRGAKHAAPCLLPGDEPWPHLCWPVCCCCTAFPSVALTARGKCAVWANSSGSEASSAPSGWWCSPESGRWSCWPKTNNFQREELAAWVGGWKKKNASNAADLRHCPIALVDSSGSRNGLQRKLFGDSCCSMGDYRKFINLLNV